MANKAQKKNKATRNKKNKKQNDKTQFSATTPALGVCNLVFFVFYFLFFCFCFFFVSCFLVYVGVILKGNSLPVLPL